MSPLRLEARHADELDRAARPYPGTPFNLNYADDDGKDVALCLGDLLRAAGWSQLSAPSPAPGFLRRGVILWASPHAMAITAALAIPLREIFMVEVVERHDGGPVAVTVGQATWAMARGLVRDGDGSAPP
ncbi:MAG: hypothetical protein M3Z65_00975 [Chloroflexota bacterium]|nr:hypothetical protein [Chloroflexota bacterium]